MKVLVTGAFGNIGKSTLQELVKQGHAVRCFDLHTQANATTARKFKNQVDVIWGDLRRRDDVTAAVRDQQIVIHLAFIIPKLSVTGFESEDYPDWAREINVGGTQNLIEAMEMQAHPPKLIFASSYHIYGRTHHLPPPRTVADPVQPIEHYAHHKVECEQMIRSSGLKWAIFRLAATLPIAMKLDPGMFDIPLDNRMEYVHTRDVGLAFANAVTHPGVWGKILLIGGGPCCQYTYREITQKVLEGIGVGMLPEEAFASTPFPTDWIDTSESQALLHYQRHTLDDYVRDMQAWFGPRRYLIRGFRPVVRKLLLKQSVYYHAGHSDWLTTLIQWFRSLKRRPTRIEVG
jgi:UDP-glucose 4-epimerase